MEEVTLVAEVGRAVGKSGARKARREGKVPAVVYGLGTDPLAVAVPERELAHILSGPGGMNTLINLMVDGERQLVVPRQVQRHPVRHNLLHLDLVRVSRDTAVTTEVPIHLIGEAPGVKDGGLLEQPVFTLTIEAKPGDVPTAIEVEVGGLHMGDHISVGDLRLPRGVTALQDAEDRVVQVVQPRGMVLPEEIAAAEAAEAEAQAAETATAGEPTHGAAAAE
jgi:large subunit ribosomal protein L25